MKKYEIMYILPSVLEENVRKATSEALHAILVNGGAKITKVEEWGSRELAYEIKKNKRGFYVILNIEAEGNEAINEFNRLAAINDKVLRHMVVRLD